MRGMANGILLRLPCNHPSNMNLQFPQQKCGAQD